MSRLLAHLLLFVLSAGLSTGALLLYHEGQTWEHEAEDPAIQFYNDMLVLIGAIKDFRSVHQRYPTPEEGLEILAMPQPTDPRVLIQWQEPVAQSLLDPWGRAYRLILFPPEGGDPFGIYSLGEDGLSRTFGNDPDDLNSWSGASTYYLERRKALALQNQRQHWLPWTLGLYVLFALLFEGSRRCRRSTPKSTEWEVLDAPPPPR